MKEKKGFTLVELLAVIALLAIVAVIGSYGVSGVTTAVKKQQWNNKVNLIENRAKVLGEDNKVLLTGQCSINDVPHNNAKIITVQNLIDKKYITTNEKDNHGDKVITNDITGDSINNWKICVYLEDNTVYAKLADETRIEEGDTNPVEPDVPYNNPRIVINTTTSSTSSISVTMVATPGDSPIDKCQISKDNGSTWTTIIKEDSGDIFTESNGDMWCTHRFKNLEPGTSYNIKVKAIDTNGHESNIASDTIDTLSHIKPSVSITSSSSTKTSITVTAKGISGSSLISKYKFSSDGGNNWITVSSTAQTYTYTFNNLTENTTYNIQVMAIATNNDESPIASKSIKTKTSSVTTLKKVSSSYTGEIWGYKDKITKIVFENSLIAHPTAKYTFDVSSTQNEEIMAYMVSTGTNQYTAYIQANGNILANPDSSYLFYDFDEVRTIEGLDKLDTSLVTDMSYMFNDCYHLTTLDLSNFNTSQVTSMSRMFSGITYLTTLDLSSFDTSKVTAMNSMFRESYNLTSINLSSFNTSNVEFMNWMFSGCESLKSIDLRSFNTSKVMDMFGMFWGCKELTTLDLSSFTITDTRNFAYGNLGAENMFYNCQKLETLNIKNMDFSKIDADMAGSYDMFDAVKDGIRITVKNSVSKTFIEKELSSKSKTGTVVIG